MRPVHLQAVEQGQTVLTRNVREFDWFDQLLPGNRILLKAPPTCLRLFSFANLRRFSQPYSWPSPVLVDELDAGGF